MRGVSVFLLLWIFVGSSCTCFFAFVSVSPSSSAAAATACRVPRYCARDQGIPYMFNSPSLLFDLSGRHATATLPGWGTGMPRRMTLGDRLQNAISPRALSVFLTPAFISMNKVREVATGGGVGGVRVREARSRVA